VLKFSVTTVFADGDDAVVLIPAAAIVIVVIPADPVLAVAPEKLIAVSDVPTDDPPDLTSIPETTPERLDPSPEKLVAVTTPTALIPPARTLIPVLAVTTPTESILVTSHTVSVPTNRYISH
jgi:hypothetical protein